MTWRSSPPPPRGSVLQHITTLRDDCGRVVEELLMRTPRRLAPRLYRRLRSGRGVRWLRPRDTTGTLSLFGDD